MLCIMLRLEEFPTDSLALLPSAIRRRLFLGLAHADLLHVDTEVLFGDRNLKPPWSVTRAVANGPNQHHRVNSL